MGTSIELVRHKKKVLESINDMAVVAIGERFCGCVSSSRESDGSSREPKNNRSERTVRFGGEGLVGERVKL